VPTVAEVMAAAFVEAGVERAFTVPGESFLALLDALVAAGIRVIATRHEGGASFMAEATGKLTGRPSLCMGTRAVGTANLAIGIHTARQDSTPMITVAGQVSREFRGREAFQEVELAESFGGLAKWARELHHPERVHDLLREGLRRWSPADRGRSCCRCPRTCSPSRRPISGRARGRRWVRSRTCRSRPRTPSTPSCRSSVERAARRSSRGAACHAHA
jgi:thiamine pyrophosphate-dependent acetolactate synthase large subunit-like protein